MGRKGSAWMYRMNRLQKKFPTLRKHVQRKIAINSVPVVMTSDDMQPQAVDMWCFMDCRKGFLETSEKCGNHWTEWFAYCEAANEGHQACDNFKQDFYTRNEWCETNFMMMPLKRTTPASAPAFPSEECWFDCDQIFVPTGECLKSAEAWEAHCNPSGWTLQECEGLSIAHVGRIVQCIEEDTSYTDALEDLFGDVDEDGNAISLAAT